MGMPFSFFSTAWIFDWVQSPTWRLVVLLLLNIFWIPILWWLLHEIWHAWKEYVQNFFDEKREFIVLAIDVPRDTEQTPLGMEAIFNQLCGAHGTMTEWEKKWEGVFQEWFSFEIVSIDGYVQYIFRMQKDLRDLVEASIYAHYPDAEITEIRDYAKDIPNDWPNSEWEMFGTEYNLAKESAYPIRVYREFEDKVRGEFLDPMAGLLEIMSKIGKGEQIWYQVLAEPIVDPDWAPEAQAVIDEIVEKNTGDEHDHVSFFKALLSLPGKLLGAITSMVFFPDEESHGDKHNDKPRTNVLMLTPGERTVVEEMERKLTKLAFKCRVRIAYFAKQDVYKKARGVGPVIGAVKQFNDATKNYFKVGKKTWTKANYAFKKARVAIRQRRFVKAMVGRSLSAGEATKGYVLNTEELATIYHFPLMSVKAPLLKRTGARKSEPPPSLPIDMGEGSVVSVSERAEPSEKFVPEPAFSEPTDAQFGTDADGAASFGEPSPAPSPAPTPSSAPASPASAVQVPSGDGGITFVEIPDEEPANEPEQERA
ncbi:MAG: hypothetical protein HY461_02810 [Parcubacteria group bacterium]|nr:hypothetical protein [Parcubacteria group bacterium]